MKRSTTYHLIDFVRPDGFWPYPCTVEQAFGLLGWMVRMAEELAEPEEQPYAGDSVKALLSCQPTCTGFRQINPITSLLDLERRFHFALLGNDGGPESFVSRWRGRCQIDVANCVRVAFPHYAFADLPLSHHDLKLRLEALFQEVGKLKVQLNPCHKRARECYGVRAHYSGFSHNWRFVLLYGYGGSEWSHVLGEQGKRETFVDAFLRAEQALAELKK